MKDIKKIILIFFLTFFFFSESKAIIKDSLYVTIGNKAVTHSDIIDEIKMILLLNGQSYSEENKNQLKTVAIRNIIKRKIKEMEIEKYKITSYNQNDLNNQLNNLAKKLNTDLGTLKKRFKNNKVDFAKVESNTKIDLIWNTLIFQLYKHMVAINVNEIDEKLKMVSDTKETREFLISEIIINYNNNIEVENQINELKKKIKNNGFEKTAINLSVAESSLKGGDLGWIEENVISESFKNKIINTKKNEISEPIFLKEGILIFKVRDIKVKKLLVDLEKIKDQLVENEKQKILNMHSLSHYDSLKQSISIKFY